MASSDEGDLTDLLRDWPYESGEINVRLLQANDGRPIIQMRVDLGVLQMEVEGRPDGRKFDGFESVFHLVADRLRKHLESGAERGAFVVSNDDCRRLREEAIQYYHRYVSLFALEEFGGVVRDTQHNLRIMDLCREFGETPFDRNVMEQLRTNTIMMRTRAEATRAANEGQRGVAIAAIDQGLEDIRQAILNAVDDEEEDEEGEGGFVADESADDLSGVEAAAGLLAEDSPSPDGERGESDASDDDLPFDGPQEMFEQSPEVQMLRAMRDALVPKLPISQRGELNQRLMAALASENYELAAILRDELRMLKD